jgi:hypothetical protein
VRPRGEALVWGIFGGIAFLGFIASFGIRGVGLESEEWEEGSDDEDVSGEEEDGIRSRSR